MAEKLVIFPIRGIISLCLRSDLIPTGTGGSLQ